MAEQRFAVLIGSSKFPDEPRLQPLRLPENDVDGIEEVLKSQVHGPAMETVVLKNRPSHEVLRTLNQILSRAPVPTVQPHVTNRCFIARVRLAVELAADNIALDCRFQMALQHPQQADSGAGLRLGEGHQFLAAHFFDQV